ncbi:AraC-type DNA-binding protein [Rhizobiales bacterium GAS191]|nr:AraC-type DNA-binding protein [Rhizobiales bacterium GAS191]
MNMIYRQPMQNVPKAPLISVANLGSVELVTLSQETSTSIEQLTELAYARANKFVLVLVENGSISAAQRGRQCRLEAGQYAFFDCSNAIRFAAIGDYKLLGIFIPGFLLQARLRNMPAIVAQPLACTGSPWRIAANLVRMLTNEIRHIPAPTAYCYANQVVELVCVAVEADTQSSFDFTGRNAIFRRCAAYVKSHLADCSLDPNMIADAMGISVRYLHKVFQESGESVCEYLRSARLETSRLVLADPQKASIQIREIAHRVGFRSQAHFAAAFKSRYGISATTWRRTASEKLAADPVCAAMVAEAA